MYIPDNFSLHTYLMTFTFYVQKYSMSCSSEVTLYMIPTKAVKAEQTYIQSSIGFLLKDNHEYRKYNLRGLIFTGVSKENIHSSLYTLLSGVGTLIALKCGVSNSISEISLINYNTFINILNNPILTFTDSIAHRSVGHRA